MEIFKDIPGYESIYQVSDLGNVKSLIRTGYNHGIYPFKTKEKMLKQVISTNGKLMVGLYLNKKHKSHQVHQLVAMAFLGHVPNGHSVVVDHIDNNPLNNNLNNIQLISQRENASKDRINCSSKFTGVSWIKNSKKWMATIMIEGKNKSLGMFANEIDAHYAYQNKLSAL